MDSLITVDRHALPVIHCLMTGKDEELYKAIMLNIRSLLPELNPTSSMSDWEPAPRNALKEVSKYKYIRVLVSLHTTNMV